ncbi:MAG TPA: ferrochelatase [Rhodocyclaceae bacterium]|nr:ferrochelatase [Rhodocyclaceae bacterium]HMV53778.1 ferrochelatase [Rhodocyclaceae bacterium]HMZ84109.1 ferrochelatase [Rhodocyclaceae bacterium]HNA02292.1 ferrochelatase [Rhodocyclaceae bacterium]HNB78290.1 ferrochelatase [Rhodocyclaceae bacterium]
MPRYLTEPAHSHASAARTAVLLVNLGTPAAPTAAALRPYLREFLSDPRVVEIPRALWLPILHGIILNTRPAKSAKKYASIWTPDGSPLKAHTERQTKLLRGYLGQAGHGEVIVEYAMRYGAPSVASVLDALRAQRCERILVVPLYPQYAASTTASVFDAVSGHFAKCRNVPELRFVRSFHDHPGYIKALAASIGEHWMKHGRADKLVMSFHGVPRYTLDKGDPYHCLCHKTARLVAEQLGLQPEAWQVTFQSRFGKAEWLQPYTQPTLEALGRGGTASVDLVCPGFVADCLETLEEIAMENRDAFLAAGGKTFNYIPCLNERHEWIAALQDIVQTHLGNWPTLPVPDATQRAASQARAKAMGARE